MSTAFCAADILIPQLDDMTKWSVVACDQYTSQPEYWAKAAELTAGSPSALELILPEAYLGADDADKRIDSIHEKMKEYLAQNIFKCCRSSMIYVERMTSDGMRAGLVGAVDLEEYDYRKGSGSLIRATEATVTERIPPRVKVRAGATLELSHIMMLIDDGQGRVIEPLAAKKNNMPKLYDFELMQGGGRIAGYLLSEEDIAAVTAALEDMGSKRAFENRYGIKDAPVLLYAVGDGNHSLASAKEHYERLKAENPGKDMSDHPARYALCELVNLHSPALRFEAIHRVVKGVDGKALIAAMEGGLKLTGDGSKEQQSFTVISEGKERKVYVNAPTANLTVGSLQGFLDKYLKENGGSIDYIHGSDVVRKLAAEGCIGFLLPDMGKEELFLTVIRDGALPRKTFSMGHAEDKRFYTECRKIQ